jgi:hypothetical protein
MHHPPMLKRALVAPVVFLVSVGTAYADDLSAARGHFQRGSTAYDLGRFLDAAHEYEAAYEANGSKPPVAIPRCHYIRRTVARSLTHSDVLKANVAAVSYRLGMLRADQSTRLRRATAQPARDVRHFVAGRPWLMTADRHGE